MRKQFTLWKSIAFLVLAIFSIFVCQVFVFLFGEDYGGSPGHFNIYPESSYYEIDPETILDTVNLGENDMFTPFFGDWNREEPYFSSITWTQSDFLIIANALSLKIWREPLDLESWDVKYMSLSRSCTNSPNGYDALRIVYYKSLGITNWERHYTTRLIEIRPWKGLVRWGGDAAFSTPLLLGWDGIDLTKFEVTADDALQIAEKNGGSDVRLKVDNACWIALYMDHNPPLKRREIWEVEYERTGFYIDINPYTGKYKILH